jgi:uncharacterized protein (DUF1778 family)
MSSIPSKKSNITIYLTENEKSKIISMAQAMGQEVDKFILNIVLPKSKKIINKSQLSNSENDI